MSMRRPKIDGYAERQAAALARHRYAAAACAMSWETKPVTGPDGTVYPSRAAAARALGVSTETVRTHMLRFGNLDAVGGAVVPCSYRGTSYPSLRACALAIGVSPVTLQSHLERYGHIDFAGVGRGGRVVDNGCSKEITIGPVWWPNAVCAARDLGLNRGTLHGWLKPTASDAQRDKLIGMVMKFAERKRVARLRSLGRAA